MKKFIIPLVSISFLLTVSSCDDYLGDNVDENQKRFEDLTPADELPTTIVYSASAHYNVALSMCQYSQQIASYFEPSQDTHEETQISGGWSLIYLQALADLKTLDDLATDEGSTAYQGIAKVLLAQNLGLATDQWGDVPANTATQGETNFTPSFESQENVYTYINILLDDSIMLLGQNDPSGLQVGEDDLIYNGNLSKWIKAAYFLKAKYAIHLTEVDQASAIAAALAAVSKAFTTNTDDFQLIYNTRNFNPWYAGVVLPNNTGNFSVLLSDQLISLMNGTQFPFTTIARDPRLPKIARIPADATAYRGALNGAEGVHEFGPGGNNNIRANTVFDEQTFYSTQTAPIILGSYAELKFIEAEALFLQNGGTNNSTGASAATYAAYLEGIAANMDKLGVVAAEKNAYLTDSSIAVGAGSLTLALIMREKYIATFLNPESFVDLRRYDFSPLVFRGLALPENHNEVLMGKWVRRAQYPSSEQTRNGTEVERVSKTIDVGVWWDRE